MKLLYMLYMDELLKHYAKSRKPDIKGHIRSNCIYMECPEQADPWRHKAGW